MTASPPCVPVLLPLPLAGAFDYAVPQGMTVVPGDIVIVPLNGRAQVGVVWDGPAGAAVAPNRLKAITEVIPTFRLDRTLRAFIDWVAAYTLSAPGEVLAMSLRQHALTPDRPTMGLRRPERLPQGRMTQARQRVLDVLAESVLPGAELVRRAGVSAQIVRAMVQGGWLQPAPHIVTRVATRLLDSTEGTVLSAAQASAAQVLRARAAAAAYSVTLLQGATGSGKTEVYLEAVRSCVAAGRQALILLPEIALSAQWLSRFERRFGVLPAVWHSELGARSRRQTWRDAAAGHAPVIVGARSALFLPLPALGLIVVDEEHETSFKQEDGVVYHARDMAVVRGRLSKAVVVLVSATPSLETLANVQAGRYARLELKDRYGGARLPSITVVDLRAHPPDRGAFLSPALSEQIDETLSRGDQAMLFLNRRGYAPLTLCRACGHRIQCPNCTAWLVEHRLRRALACHHCAHAQPVPLLCPACSAEHSLVAVGPGVERITEEAAARFPAARQLVMASDTLQGPGAATRAAAAIEARQVDLIVGTQMAAKGWHFPHLTFVGVVDADLGLAGGDLRAGERTMQLLHQVAGRAGRAQAMGAVMLQTYQPEHPVIASLVAGDLDGFMREEAAQRRPGNWPPYGRLAALIISAEDAETADTMARALGRAAPSGPGITVLGPAPAPLAVLRGRHRRRLLLRTVRNVPVQPLLRTWLAQVRTPRGVRVEVDVDPISFL